MSTSTTPKVFNEGSRSGLLLGAIPTVLRKHGPIPSREGPELRSPKGQSAYLVNSLRARSRQGTQRLSEVLGSLPTEEFISRFWTKSYGYFPGKVGRFGELLRWSDLNKVLQGSCLGTSRITLVREGKQLPSESFRMKQSAKVRNGWEPCLSHSKLNAELRDGATLIVNGIDEFHPPISDLAADLERLFRARVQINLYVGWRKSPCFDVHWDGHEVMVLQVSGRKQWRVYGKTTEYPQSTDRNSKLEPPKLPIWEGQLSDGDVLYLPRGWWHAASPVDEPTLHLTIGVHNHTGADLLSWFVNSLQSVVDIRRDLPLFEDEPSQTQHLQNLLKTITDAWHADLISDYFNYTDVMSEPRGRFSLPWSATPEVLPPDGYEARLEWIPIQCVNFGLIDSGRVFSIGCHGNRWLFAPRAQPIIELMMHRHHCTVHDVLLSGTELLSSALIQQFIKELILCGLVAVAIPTLDERTHADELEESGHAIRTASHDANLASQTSSSN